MRSPVSRTLKEGQAEMPVPLFLLRAAGIQTLGESLVDEKTASVGGREATDGERRSNKRNETIQIVI